MTESVYELASSDWSCISRRSLRWEGCQGEAPARLGAPPDDGKRLGRLELRIVSTGILIRSITRCFGARWDVAGAGAGFWARGG